MQNKKTIIFVFFIIVAAFSFKSDARTRLSMDKSPNESKENEKKAHIATINNEKLLQQLLEQTKKTNELLQGLLNKD